MKSSQPIMLALLTGCTMAAAQVAFAKPNDQPSAANDAPEAVKVAIEE